MPDKKMKVYSVKHRGHYPGRACSIVVAEHIEEAMLLMKAKLREMGIHTTGICVTEIATDIAVPYIQVILDSTKETR